MSELPDSAGRMHTWLGSLAIVVACFEEYANSGSIREGEIGADDCQITYRLT